MKKVSLPLRSVFGYLAIGAGMALLNFALPAREPLSFALFFGALFAGLNPFILSAEYLAASAVNLSGAATLSAAAQAAFLLIVSCIYARLKKRAGIERAAYALVAQLPFIFLFPHAGYSLFSFDVRLQKLILGVFLVMLSMLFEGGMSAILHRVFRCKLTAGEDVELAILWLFAGMGMLNSLGAVAFSLLALSLLLFSVLLVRGSSAIPFSILLSLPLCVTLRSALPLAEYAVYATLGVLFAGYGKTAASLSVFAAYAGAMLLEGLYDAPALSIVFTLLACALPALAGICIPEKLFRRAEKSLLFYRERMLPRIAVNRSRRAVAEQLYEVSSLFREIGYAFESAPSSNPAGEQIKSKLYATLCAECEGNRACERAGVFSEMEKMIAVGKAKGRVNLIDLPVTISKECRNATGLLFALNRLLAEYSKVEAELESAREGRRLLAGQAHGVSEILRDIALSQSEEYTFSEEERTLGDALAEEGVLGYEIFLYGEGASFTVSVTLDEKTEGRRVAAIASRALKVPLALSEKIPLTSDRACFIFRKKPLFDAAFGIAARTKEGEMQSGDTHSILKIDERRFMVALSDGMGSGEEAHAVSDSTLSLLESFYKAKMPSETVFSTVNKLLAFSTEESFSCLDLAAVDLDTGIADVVKIGSPVGFVLSGDTLQVLEGESLPIGVLDAVHPACLRVEMKADDFLIFMSDGVTAAFGSNSELCAYLSRLQPINPQSLAEDILNCALSRFRGRAEDDMTVLAVKLTA